MVSPSLSTTKTARSNNYNKQGMLFGGWSMIVILLSLMIITVTSGARAITVSHSPALTTRHRRRHHHHQHWRPISLTQQECRLVVRRDDGDDDWEDDVLDDDMGDLDDDLLLHDEWETHDDCHYRLDTLRGGATATRTTAAAAATVEKPWVEGFKNSIASALAAALSKTILAPFDTIKTLQQYHQATSSVSSLTLLEAARIIMERPGGFWNFYAGLGVSVLGAMPSVAMYFGTYSYFKKALAVPRTRRDGTTYTLPRTFVIGMSAAIGNTFASFSRVPYEVLKQKLQTNTYRNTLEALRDITSWEMIFPKGGIAIQMMRDIPYAVVTLLLYEHLQAWNSQQIKLRVQQEQLLASSSSRKIAGSKTNKKGSTESKLQQASSDMLLGAIAGGIGSWVTNPLDVIKTRLQTAPPEVYEGSITKCIAETWKEGGGMAFLRGSWPRLMHKIPANGFFFLFYEFFRRVLRCQGYDE